MKANLIVQGINEPELQERVSEFPKTATSLQCFPKMSHLPYDPKPEQLVKLLETLERLFHKLNPGVTTEERKCMALS